MTTKHLLTYGQHSIFCSIRRPERGDLLGGMHVVHRETGRLVHWTPMGPMRGLPRRLILIWAIELGLDRIHRLRHDETTVST